jgi:peptide/nickel transport system permease protein
MKSFVLRRLGIAAITLLGVSVVVFALIHLQPGNPYSSMMDPSISQEAMEARLTALGYYDPLPIQYFKWLGRVFTGDFGYSTQYKAPVEGLILEALGNTLVISVPAFVISGVLAIVLGVVSAALPYTWIDRVITIFSFIGISVPTFFFGVMLVKWFGYDLGILPASGMISVTSSGTGWDAFTDVLSHMVLPVAVLCLTQVATLLRYTRSAVLDVIGADFMRTARAKGLTYWQAIWRHGLRNSLLPVVTVVTMQLPLLLSGALITETVFVWPGVGTLNYNAILNHDYMLVMGVTMMLAVAILVSNLLADVLYAVVDPRVRLGKEG